MNELEKEIKIATATYTVSLIVIAVIGISSKITGNDILNKTLFESKWLGKLCGENGMYCSWPISHFILYLVLGIACPRIWPILFAAGIVWEIIEWIIGNFLSEKESEETVQTQYSNGWMTGKWSDLLFNGAGLALGLGIRKVYDSNKDKKNKKPPTKENTASL